LNFPDLQAISTERLNCIDQNREATNTKSASSACLKFMMSNSALRRFRFCWRSPQEPQPRISGV
jgi:hypothetical protein